MDQKFSPRVQDIMLHSREEAVNMGNPYIGLEHIFLGIVNDKDSNAVQILKNLDLDIEAFKQKLEASIKTNNVVMGNANNLPLTKQAERALKFTYIVAKDFNSEQVASEHLMLAILHDDNNIVSQRLEYEGITYSRYKKEIEKLTPNYPAKSKNDDLVSEPTNVFQDEDEEDEVPTQTTDKQQRKGATKSATPILDSFGRDLTKAAEEGRLDPIVGRDKELERISQVLSRRKKNNPILIGEPGVGKSAIAEGLAQRIVAHNVSRTIYN